MRALRTVMLVVCVAGVIGLVAGIARTWPGRELMAARAESRPSASGPRAPEFPTGVTWLNTPRPLTMKALRGKVVLVDFWEYTCVNCIRTLPYVKQWHERYKDKGLVIVGVHAPEFEFARDPANVTRAARQFGLTYPIAVDSGMAIWNAYGNRFWPAKYLIDRNGVVRAHHFGEGGYGDTEEAIQRLLKEIYPQVALPKILEPIRGEDRPGAVCYPVTPELYAGYQRGELGNSQRFSPDRVARFTDPGQYREGLIYVQGLWLSSPEALIHPQKATAPEDYIAIRYRAIEVNSVLKPEMGRPVRLYVTHDGKPVAQADKGADIRYTEDGRSYVLVDQPRMYNVIKNAKWGTHTLKLATGDEGLGLYSFTFTSCAMAGE